METIDLKGKTAIVTGANCGIGKETAKQLAERGARVILACRNYHKACAAQQDIIEETNNENVAIKILDLSSLDSVRTFASDVNKSELSVDLLINNAGVISVKRTETQHGFETQFGVNHLGHFLLTNLLLEKLKQSAPSRVIVVTSSVHRCRQARLNLRDLQLTRNYSAFKAYARSKTANLLFAHHLAKLLDGTGVAVLAVDPGVVRTRLGREFALFDHPCLQDIFKLMVRCVSKGHRKVISPKAGALTSVHCCVDARLDDVTGKCRYFSKHKECCPAEHAQDDDIAAELWKISSDMVGLKPAPSRTRYMMETSIQGD